MRSERLAYVRRYYGPVGRLRRAGLRQGLLQGNTGWLAVWIAITTGATLKRHLTRREQFVTADRLLPGQGLVIRSIPVKSAKERKRLLRGQN
jgi:hypothetical protein